MRRLADVGVWRSGGTPPKKRAELWNGGFPWVSTRDLKTPVLATSTETITEDAARRFSTSVPAGSLLIGTRGMALAKRLPVGIAGRDVAFNQDIKAIEPYADFCPKYLLYALLAFERSILGLTDEAAHGTKRLDTDLLRAFRIPTPPRPEQQFISDFLDAETARIDKMIALRVRQEQLLSERIKLQMDRRLNGDPATSSWQIGRLARLCDSNRPIQYGIVLPGPNVETGVLLVKGGDVKPGRLDPASLSRTARDIEAAFSRSRLQERDIVIAIRGGVGDVELIPGSLAGGNITQDVARIAPLPGVDERWLLHALRSPTVQRRVQMMVTGATIKGINIGDLRRISLSVPPPEQQHALGEELTDLDAARSRASFAIRHQIALLRERRQALITAAVTGKLDVG